MSIEDDKHTDDLRRVWQALAVARAELEARRARCICRWSPKTGLLYRPECPEHGLEHDDLISLGRAAREAGLDIEGICTGDWS